MNDTISKSPDQIYCPGCAKPIQHDAVVCPKCGIQVKELKVSSESMELQSFDKNSNGANYLVKTDTNTLAQHVRDFFKAEGYELENGSILKGGYTKGSLGKRVLAGPFANLFKFNVEIEDKDGVANLLLSKGMSGFSGGLIGVSKMNKETERIRTKLYHAFAKK